MYIKYYVQTLLYLHPGTSSKAPCFTCLLQHFKRWIMRHFCGKSVQARPPITLLFWNEKPEAQPERSNVSSAARLSARRWALAGAGRLRACVTASCTEEANRTGTQPRWTPFKAQMSRGPRGCWQTWWWRKNSRSRWRNRGATSRTLSTVQSPVSLLSVQPGTRRRSVYQSDGPDGSSNAAMHGAFRPVSAVCVTRPSQWQGCTEGYICVISSKSIIVLVRLF